VAAPDTVTTPVTTLVSVAEAGGSCTGTISGCTTFAYDANDARTTTSYPGGTVSERRTIDAAGRAADF